MFFLYKTHRLIFLIEEASIYCAVRPGSLNKIDYFSFQMVKVCILLTFISIIIWSCRKTVSFHRTKSRGRVPVRIDVDPPTEFLSLEGKERVCCMKRTSVCPSDFCDLPQFRFSRSLMPGKALRYRM